MQNMLTHPWNEIVAHYEAYKGERRSIRELGNLARQINESSLGKGLFAWTSMFDLCITQTEVGYPYDGPFLRLSPVSDDQIEFRYLDTQDRAQQWHRTVESTEALTRLIKFLDQLRWFPPDVLKTISSEKRLKAD